MRHALRILRKDTRHLWPRVALTWALLALHARNDAATPTMPAVGVFGTLLAIPLLIASWFLVVSVVHQERAPGDRQYWLTRPIPLGSLLLAKTLFILLYLNLPVLLLQAASLAVSGISPVALLPQLLLRQLFFTIFLVLPPVLLAAVTRNLVQFTLGTLAMALVWLVSSWYATSGWGSVEPVLSWTLAAILLAAAARTLTVQYARRRTGLSRTIFIGAVLLVSGLRLVPLPPGAARVQTWFSSHVAAADNVRIAFDPVHLPANVPDYTNFRFGNLFVQIPLRVTGIPAGWSLSSTAVRARWEAAGGRRSGSPWSLGGIVPPGAGASTVESGATTLGSLFLPFDLSGPPSNAPLLLHSGEYVASLPVEEGFFASERERPVHLRATFALTLFAPPHTARLHVPSRPVPVWGHETLTFSPIEGMGPCNLWENAAPSVMVTCWSPLSPPGNAILTVTPSPAAPATTHFGSWTGATAFGAWQGFYALQQDATFPMDLTVETRETASRFLLEIDVPEVPLNRCLVDFPAGGFAGSSWVLF